MGVFGFILTLVVLGAISGYIGRLLVPGPDPLSFLGTVVLGVVGSFVGGFVGWAIFGADEGAGPLQRAGIIGSVLGSVVALLLYNAVGPGDGDRSSRA